jgi:hypothetical protein
MNERRRAQGAVLAGAGLGALVLVLVATPDAAAWVFGAWILVLAGVSAVALGIALGFRHQARLDRPDTRDRPYLTPDWTSGAQVFTVGGGLDAAVLEPTEAEAKAAEESSAA